MDRRLATMLIHLVCGARPNFMKIAPLYHALAGEEWALPMIVHTGQHYDRNMSASFFEDLRLPEPHVYLGVGSGTHAEQTARIMVAYEKVVQERRPDLVVVVGDVNSTLAAALVASKLRIAVAHLEAGLRSFDRTMPEEINRVVTDAVSDLLWVPSRDATDNLLAAGTPEGKIEFVGNIMIDSLEMLRDRIESRDKHLEYGLAAREYAVVTLHRPSNVDDPATLADICRVLDDLSQAVPLVFPVHPRTRRLIDGTDMFASGQESGRIILPEPLGYMDFISLVFNCRLVVTDSGGVQEETSYLGIPCLTLRENTERPITVTQGTNQLCRVDGLKRKVTDILEGLDVRRPKIERWDGRTAERIVAALRRQHAADARSVPEDHTGIAPVSKLEATQGV